MENKLDRYITGRQTNSVTLLSSHMRLLVQKVEAKLWVSVQRYAEEIIDECVRLQELTDLRAFHINVLRELQD